MQQNRITPTTFAESNGHFFSVDHFINNVSTMKEMTCDIKGTMLSLIASLPIDELPVSQTSFQQLIIFVTENCNIIENTIIKTSK